MAIKSDRNVGNRSDHLFEFLGMSMGRKGVLYKVGL